MDIKKNKYFALFKFEKSDFFGISFLLIILFVTLFFKYQYNIILKEHNVIHFKVLNLQKDTLSSFKAVIKNELKKDKKVLLNVDKKDKIIPKRKVDINLANLDELKLIKGIGDVLSVRIIKYRNLLGGFYQIDQLKEVYGINEEVFAKIKTQVKCQQNIIIKIDLNTLEFKEMLKHPYFDYNVVKKIFELKNNHQLNSLEILKNNEIVSDKKFDKINHYFKVLD